jgi:hypothetical protein
MPDEKPKTINEEAGLPDNWVPVDRPPVEPGRQNPNSLIDGNLKYLQGSLPPTFQHDSSFVNTAYKSQNAPSASLVPLGLQGNPTTNAAIQSTASHTPSQVPPSVTTSLTINVPPQLFTPAFQVIALPGTLTIDLADQSANQFFAGPTTGSPALPTWRALSLLDFGFVFDVPHGGTGVATIPAHATMIGAGTSAIHTAGPGTAGQVLTSNGPSADPTYQAPAAASPVVKFNGSGTAIDRQVYINGVTDGSAVWTFKMNGTPDGG